MHENAPNDPPNVHILPGLLILEHPLLQRRAHPERPAGAIARAEEHAAALRDRERDARDGVRRDERAVDLDDGQRVAVDAEPDARERARVREPEAVRRVRRERELRERTRSAGRGTACRRRCTYVEVVAAAGPLAEAVESLRACLD